MVSDRWSELAQAGVDRCRTSDNWVELPENGWGALVAYLAGPGYARPLQIPFETRTVTVFEIAATGEACSREEPMTLYDIESIRESIAEFLAEVDIEAPTETSWQLCLPTGMSADDLAERLNAAVASAGDGVSRREQALREARAMARELGVILYS